MKPSETITCYAYGVTPIKSTAAWNPTTYLHYWIDSELKYNSCEKETAETPDLLFVYNSSIKVELSGHGNYTIAKR